LILIQAMSAGGQGRESQTSERRTRARYALALELSYAVLDLIRHGETGTGMTIDISSSALRFMAARPLTVGRQLEVSVRWPLLLHGAIPLQLVATGVVIRTSGRETVMQLEKHAFKTRGTGATVAPNR
jgi:hypothetical protein